MKTLNVCVEVLVHFDSVAVELELGRVEKCFVGSEAGSNMVNSLNKVDNICHGSVRHCGCDIACNCVRKRRLEVGLRKLLFPCALTVKYITEALNEDVTRTEHVCQLADLLSVSDRLIERVRKVMRAKNGKVCVVTFELLIRMTVDNGKIVVVILLAYKAAGVLAEGSYLVFERTGIADEL